MRILITNDDGWDAPGIQVMLEVASEFGDCTVVAPAVEQSGISHQVTFHRPLNLVQRSDRVWSLDGTPADCARIAMMHMGGAAELDQRETPFDLVLSGINNGGNLGSDVFISGTVAGAREATHFGIPAIAISQHRSRFKEAYDWTFSKQVARQVIQHCQEKGLAGRKLLNVNLPDFTDAKTLPEVILVDPCELDPAPLPVSYSVETVEGSTKFSYAGKYNDRVRTEGCDVDVCFSKRVSISYLPL